MRKFDIHTAYVSWGTGGKRRPVLILTGQDGTDVYLVFSITSQYANKSQKIKSNYVELQDWQQAGLSKQSWVDTINAFELERRQLNVDRVGTLSERDKQAIIEVIGD